MPQTCHCCHGGSLHYQEANLKRCSGCREVYYCSTACQNYDWVEHIFHCNPSRPINTADHLARAIRQDLLPADPQTCEDYGFNRALTDEEESNLFSLYIGLIGILRIPPKRVHNWRVRGVLVDKIKAEFYKLPEGSRGEYFPWFLQNEHIVALAGQPLSEEASHDHDDAMIVRAWRFTGGSERDSAKDIRAAIARKSAEEQQCYRLYALLLSKCHPSPDRDLWVDFGFAACTSQEGEMELGARYQELIKKCTFKEFCDAYRGRRLPGLFRSKGLQANDNGQLRDHSLGQWKKSVWYLKQSIVQEESGMHPAVMVDYGFMNCKNDSERRELKGVYKAFFDEHNGDPLALHEAAIQGNIHGYLSNVVEGLQDPKFQRLMKNPYPLPEYDD